MTNCIQLVAVTKHKAQEFHMVATVYKHKQPYIIIMSIYIYYIAPNFNTEKSYHACIVRNACMVMCAWDNQCSTATVYNIMQVGHSPVSCFKVQGMHGIGIAANCGHTYCMNIIHVPIVCFHVVYVHKLHYANVMRFII